jgi:hypothetical protein
MPLPVRNFKSDLARIAGAEQGSPVPPGTPRTTNSGPTSTTLTPTLGGAATLGGGALGPRIAAAAMARVGSPNSDYYPPDPNNACASFVSTVLRDVGLVPAADTYVTRRLFTTLANGLTKTTEKLGAVNVFGHEVPLTADVVRQIQAGDIIQFRNDSDVFDHSAVALGNGRLAGTTSSRHRIANDSILSYRKEFPHIQIHRFVR